METLRQQLAHVEPDAVEFTEGAELTDKQKKFAQVWAITGNKSVAYRQAYDVGPRTLPQCIWVSASRVADIPKVIAYYKVLSEQAANESLMTLRELLQWQIDIATADPNDLVRTVHRCCRYCHGVNFQYQWKNEDELCDAQLDVMTRNVKGEKAPDGVGGFGFNGALPPNPICPHCYGDGITHTVVADTTKLTGKARKLYAGAKQDRFGCVEIKMHDQAAAWDKVSRMLGAYNDSLDLRTPEQRSADTQRRTLPDNITLEDAGKAYIELLG